MRNLDGPVAHEMAFDSSLACAAYTLYTSLNMSLIGSDGLSPVRRQAII